MKKPMENKHEILDKLLLVLQATDNLHDVVKLEYLEENELVVATFDSGYSKIANVALDSGTAMICDVIRQII